MKHNFIEKYKVPEKICDNLIKYYKNNVEYKNKGQSLEKTKDSTDVMFYNPSNNEYINNFFHHLGISIQKYVKKFKICEKIHTELGNNIQYYKPGGGYPNLHYERSNKMPNRMLVYMLYLNTVTDKGGTEFPLQNITLSAIKGDLYIWPAEFTHPHKGIISPTQEKYIATGWFELVN